jgi:hypothetical protein
MPASYLSVLSAIDPTLLPGVRDQLAETFAAKIVAVLPTVSEFIEFESELIADAKARRSLAEGAALLYSRSANIRTSLIADFTSRFDAIRDPVQARSRRPRLALAALSLVQDEHMEEEIAIIACSQRLKEQSEYELFSLSRQLCMLMGQERMADDANPIYPRVFARALLHSLGALAGMASTRLAMFKAFGPLLLEILPETYAIGSAWLTEHGVTLEKYVYHPVIMPERTFQVSPPARPTDSSTFSNEQISELIDALQLVLPTARPALASAGNMTSGATTVPIARARQNVFAENPQASAALARELLDTMLDILCSDDRVPAAVRPCIERLREPLARLIVLDRSFFTWSAHPARKLLEKIAEFGMALQLDPADLESVNSVAQIVEDIVRREGSDHFAFKLALKRLEELFHHHEECALAKDPDILVLEASELRECAINAASATISARLDGRRVPVDVVAFIVMTWRAVLVSDFLHGGKDGAPWKLGVATLDELLKSIEPLTQRDQRTDRVHSLSSMLELIRDGISHAEMNPLLADDFLQVLHTLHQQAMRGTDKGAWQHLMPLRYPPPASCGLAATESPRNLLANLGLVAGMWLDFPRGGIPHYWRLCWVTPFRGHCVLRHYESRSTRVISTAELRAELSLRTAVIVNDLGLVSSAVGRSFKQVNESIRSRGRAQSADVSRPDASASGSTPDEDVRHPALS